MQMIRLFLLTLAVAGLVACGGGGGGGSPFGGDAGGGGGGGGGGSASPASVVMSISSVTVSAASPSTVTARVTTSSGTPLPNLVVTFVSTNGLGAFSAPTALTNADGLATVTLAPASATTVGADTVLASTTVSGTAVTGSIGFQLTATNVTISTFTSELGSGALLPYGQTLLTVRLAGTSPTVPVNVALSSACVSQGRATLTPATVSTSTGTATFTYRDGGCGAFNGTDSLQASVTGTSATASLNLTLTAPAVASVAFVSAVPNEIFLRGSGFVENSNITFQVRDANGLGVPNQDVVLEATTLAGGLTLEGVGTPVTRRSDANGNVIVRINSGTVPTPVRVRATLVSSGISSFSSNLAVAVGLPSQQNFSLSQGTFNIEGYNIDGVTNTYRVIASDRLGNPVPADTAINFIAEGGQVQAIRFTTLTNGLASATANFQTSSPRPEDGRVTVLAYALGEESFLDANGDNVYSPGEDFQDLGDVFLDRLFNRSFNVARDQFISLSIAGTDACRNADAADLLGLQAESPSRTLSTTGAAINSCVAGWGRAYVRKASQTVFSTSTARLGWRQAPGDSRVRSVSATARCLQTSLIDQIGASPYAVDDSISRVPFYLLGDYAFVVLSDAGKSGAFSFLVADTNPVALNPVAAGSVITATATAGLTVSVLGGSPVANTLNPTSAAIRYEFNDTTFSGTISITVTSPGGVSTGTSQTIYRLPLDGTAPCPS
jgi:hypothetical protein